MHWSGSPPGDVAKRFGDLSLRRQLSIARSTPFSPVSWKSPDSEVSTGRGSPMRNASVSWTRSSTNDRGIHQSRLRHEHSGFRSLLEGTSIPVHAGRGGRPRDAGLVEPHLDR